jgi:hypothetical protein
MGTSNFGGGKMPQKIILFSAEKTDENNVIFNA